MHSEVNVVADRHMRGDKMGKRVLTIKICYILMFIGLVAGCSENESGNSEIPSDVLSIGTAFLNEMKASATNGDDEISEKIEELAYELKVVCIEKNDYNRFSDKEIDYIDALGEIRVAYDDLVFNRNSKYTRSEKETEASEDLFNQLVNGFERKYG